MIPWYNLSWEETQKRGLIPELTKHLADMTWLEIEEYNFYLTGFFKWPKGILHEICPKSPG